MGVYKYIREAWNKPSKELDVIQRQRRIDWRHDNVTVRLDYPTRLDRARSLGYKAKPGFVLVRQRVNRGGHKREMIRAGRKPSNYHMYLALRKNYQMIAEERVEKKYINMAVLNSYYLAQDGIHIWYEVILVDPENPSIKADKDINWICDPHHRTRVFHGKTSAGKRVRGLLGRGKGYEKARPSRRAHKRRQ